MTPNPLQELAEKLLVLIKDDMERGGCIENYPEEFVRDKLLPCIGTLLQAERAAAVESLILHRLERYSENWRCSCGFVLDAIGHNTAMDSWATHIRTLADSSALAAVVERETRELRLLLGEAASALGHRYDCKLLLLGGTKCSCGAAAIQAEVLRKIYEVLRER